MKILILGVNGFIGNSLASKILKEKDWEVLADWLKGFVVD